MHYMRKRRAEIPGLREKDGEWTKKWREANPEKLASAQQRYGQRHKERLGAHRAQWKRDNWDSYKAYLAARKSRVKQATPPWADLKCIEAFYRACPKGHHVDHIIPLNGRNVSGLHTMKNLRYLPAGENLKKSNKFAS
jgi:hypothetical protein